MRLPLPRVRFTVKRIMIAVAIVAMTFTWGPALPLLAIATAVYWVATRFARIRAMPAALIACSASVLVYVSLSGPLILLACELGEEENHGSLVAATFDGYRPLFQLARGVGLEAVLIRYVNWWVGGELGYLPKEWLGITPESVSSG